MNHRVIVRDLEPVVTGVDEEIRLQVVSANGSRRLSMTTWSKGHTRWHRMEGVLEIPLELTGELHSRLKAAVADSRDLVTS